MKENHQLKFRTEKLQNLVMSIRTWIYKESKEMLPLQGALDARGRAFSPEDGSCSLLAPRGSQEDRQ